MILNDKDKEMITETARRLLSMMKPAETEYTLRNFTLSTKAKEDLRDICVKRLERLMEPACFEMFLEYLNDIDVLDLYFENQETSKLDPHRRAFMEKLTRNRYEFLDARAPGLSHILKEALCQAEMIHEEMLSRIDQCHAEISETLLAGHAFHELTGIDESGDLHNNGHATTLITSDTGTFVYKPHDVRIDLMAHHLFRKLFSDVLYSPAVVSKDAYGFAEFIRNQPCTTEEDAKLYFHNLGGFAAVVQMLGSSDLHHNNVLASGVHPVIIDNELLITPGRYAAKDGLRKELLYSVLCSSLMPCRKGDIELSVLFASDEANRSCPVVNGVRKNVRDYPSDFLSGFQKIYHRCMACREEIAAFLQSWHDVPIRHLYRGTRDYMDLLEKTLEPGWIKDPSLRDQLFKELSVAMKRSGVSDADAIAEAETDSILRGDIPYVYTMFDSPDMYADGTMVYKNFFSSSPKDAALSRLAYLSEADLAFETKLLEKAMTSVVVRIQSSADKEENPIRETRTLSRETLIKEAEELFVRIRDDALYTPRGEIIWFAPDYFMETGMAVLGNGFIDGTAGLAVFFAAIAKMTADPSIRKDAMALAERIVERLDSNADFLDQEEVIYPNTEDLSLVSGISGKLLACRLIAKYTGDTRAKNLCQKLVNLAKKEELQYENPDVISGLSGMLKLLCRYDDLFALEGAPQLAEQLALRILGKASIPYRGKRIWRTLSPEWAISGSGHGQSGIAAALFLAAARLNRPEWIEDAAAGFAFEQNVYSETLGAWPDRRQSERTENYMSGWCSGAAGIGNDALLAAYEGHEEVIQRAVSSILKEPLLFKDFLCCGNCSMVDFMIEASRRYDPSLKDHAMTRLALIRERAKKTGHYNFQSPRIQPLFSPTLFYGAAGIGYEMLRMADCEEIESVLL